MKIIFFGIITFIASTQLAYGDGLLVGKNKTLIISMYRSPQDAEANVKKENIAEDYTFSNIEGNISLDDPKTVYIQYSKPQKLFNAKVLTVDNKSIEKKMFPQYFDELYDLSNLWFFVHVDNEDCTIRVSSADRAKKLLELLESDSATEIRIVSLLGKYDLDIKDLWQIKFKGQSEFQPLESYLNFAIKTGS